MRWVIIGLVPVLCGVSRLWAHSYDMWGIFIFFGVTSIITLCYAKKRFIKPYQWGIIHIVDLVSISLMVLGRSGIHSESFNLYYLVILQAGLVFGVRQALACGFLSTVLYTCSVLLTAPTDVEIRKLAVRVIYIWLVGITGSYLAYLEKKHQKLAITDYVTSTYNRTFMEQSLDFEINKAAAEKDNLSIIMIDIDNFKAVNDQFGHKVGDLVLEKLAGIIQSNLREIDFVARYGGEEFIVTLPGKGSEIALEIAERIRNAVEKATFRFSNVANPIYITISCGLASYPIQARNMDDLMKKADEFLYEAKRAGRNRVYSKAG